MNKIKNKNVLYEHFFNPQRMGELDSPDGIGIIGNAQCGDILILYIKVKDKKVEKVRFKCLGCGASKAVASYIAELCEGKPIEEIEQLKMEEIFEDLKELPKNKWHCPFQALDALKMAIDDWKSREREGKRKMIDVEPLAGERRCPFCQAILGEVVESCESCQLKVARCISCGKKVLIEEE